jgi:predicted metal-dependent phosphoesterase TrpH
MIRIDLHTHSRCSDGSLTPEQLVLAAKKSHVSVMSLTDHDTVTGIAGFMRAARKNRIRPVAGIEFSAEYPATLHILGYRFDVENEALLKSLIWVNDAREARNREICKLLGRLGKAVDYDEVVEAAGGATVGRMHIARVLVRKGIVGGISEAFAEYLGRGGRAYLARDRIPPDRCLALIRGAGGLPVVAHPTVTDPDIPSLRPLLVHLKDLGLWGLECYYPSHSAGQIFECLRLAHDLGLYATAGSDYHGGRELDSLGMRVPEDLLPWGRFCGGL